MPALKLTTIAGTGVNSSTGDGGPATAATIVAGTDVVADAVGNVYISEFLNNHIRRVTPGGTISTFAGTGAFDFGGDGGPATAAFLKRPADLTVDAAGNVFFADSLNHRIRRIATNGIITTVAGNGTPGYLGDGGLATAARLMFPFDVAVDGAGNLYIADTGNQVIRKVTIATGIITTIDTSTVAITNPTGVSLDGLGNLYITARDAVQVFKVVLGTGTITPIAEPGAYMGHENVDPKVVLVPFQPRDAEADAAGNLYILDDEGGNGDRIRKLSVTTGLINTIVGSRALNGIMGISPTALNGDGGVASAGQLKAVTGIGLDPAGNIYMADQYRIRKAEVPILPPTNLVALPAGNAIRLTWTAPTGATGFRIRRGTSSGPGTLLATGPLTTPTFLDTLVELDKRYLLAVLGDLRGPGERRLQRSVGGGDQGARHARLRRRPPQRHHAVSTVHRRLVHAELVERFHDRANVRVGRVRGHSGSRRLRWRPHCGRRNLQAVNRRVVDSRVEEQLHKREDVQLGATRRHARARRLRRGCHH